MGWGGVGGEPLQNDEHRKREAGVCVRRGGGGETLSLPLKPSRWVGGGGASSHPPPSVLHSGKEAASSIEQHLKKSPGTHHVLLLEGNKQTNRRLPACVRACASLTDWPGA